MSDASPHAPTRVNPVAPNPLAATPDAGTVVPAPTPLSASRGGIPTVPGYTVFGEIARGGMGRVLSAHDPTLDREVAIKVLLVRNVPASEMARRFRQEARITAQLPHPGIPPVHQLGELDDGSPFLAMELIRGRTLAAILSQRQRPTDDLPRLLQVFEQVCQAVGFAHSQGVIHRDLKPGNVMVGEFGEVQVMDWGLATMVGQGGTAAAPTAPDPSLETTPADGSRLTYDGQILGTPAYMAPEQARGEDPAFTADVFALGGILCEILARRPTFVVDADLSTVEAAAGGKVADAFAALDASGADAELVIIAKWCLCPDPRRRPADGKAVADAVAAYRAAVEDRLHEADARRAAAEAKAAEEANTRLALQRAAAELRRHRRTQGALRAAVLVIGGLVAAGAWWHDRQAGERRYERDRTAAEWTAERVRVEAERHGTRHGVERAIELAGELRRQYRFADAGRVLANAATLAERAGADDLRPDIEQAEADLAFVVVLDKVRMERAVWARPDGGRGGFRAAAVPGGYAAAFAARGLDVAAADPADVAARVAASAVRTDLVAALDDWAAVETRDELRARILDVARRADPGEWLDRFRDPAVRADPARLAELAKTADPATLTPAAVTGLAVVMERRGLDPHRLLTAAQAAHPGDFLIAFQLGQAVLHRDSDQAVGQFRTARALRPDNFAVLINLGSLLKDRGDVDGALGCAREAVRLDPTNPLGHGNLGNALRRAGDVAGAQASYREALRLDPANPASHTNLGVALHDLGDADGAAACHREALRLDPTYATALNNLGTVLKKRGDVAGAERYFRDAVRSDPRHASAQFNLGMCLRDRGERAEAEACFRAAVRFDPYYAGAHHGLGLVLHARGDLDGAAGSLRNAVRLDPGDALAPFNLGNVLREKGDADGAVAAYRAATRLNPARPEAHIYLGTLLRTKGDTDGAVAAYRDAVRFAPDFAPGHDHLSATLLQKKDWPAAAAALREVIRLRPADAAAHYHLGVSLAFQGDTDGALVGFREAVRLAPKHAPAVTNLGLMLLTKGDLDAAEGHLREAIRLDPPLPHPRDGLRQLEKLRSAREARTAPPPRPVDR